MKRPRAIYPKSSNRLFGDSKLLERKAQTAIFSALFLLTGALFAQSQNPLDYYQDEFKKEEKHPLADTLFEKTVWHKKVSHIVIEEKPHAYQVTLLMILSYPHNYKSQNYPLYYEFTTFQEAFEKFTWLNRFLRNNGVLRITITGSKITSEKVLYEGDPG